MPAVSAPASLLVSEALPPGIAAGTAARPPGDQYFEGAALSAPHLLNAAAVAFDQLSARQSPGPHSTIRPG